MQKIFIKSGEIITTDIHRDGTPISTPATDAQKFPGEGMKLIKDVIKDK